MATKALVLKKASKWAPRQNIAPEMARTRDGGFRAASNGSEGCYGGWELLYPAGKAGTWVRCRARARWQDLERGYDSVNAAAQWLDKNGRQVGWAPLLPAGVRKGRVVYENTTCVPPGAQTLVLRLLIAWSATGAVEWSEPEAVATSPPRPRRMRLAAAGGPPPPGRRTLAKLRDFYLGLCRQAARRGVDLLCLPEVILSWGIAADNETAWRRAIDVPGPELQPFLDLAREARMALVFSVHERNRELKHNTAVLIDTRDSLVGKYRKVHLAQPSEVWDGTTPGHDFPVFKLGRARVGMYICMDSSAAESARVLARNGAEIICVPIMGDHRARWPWTKGLDQNEFDMDRWTLIQRMRAMDSHVYMVVARNNGYGSGIFSPRGEVLAVSGGGRIVHADVDLSDMALTWTGARFRDVCWYMRREPAYGPLAGALLRDPFGGAPA